MEKISHNKKYVLGKFTGNVKEVLREYPCTSNCVEPASVKESCLRKMYDVRIVRTPADRFRGMEIRGECSCSFEPLEAYCEQ